MFMCFSFKESFESNKCADSSWETSDYSHPKKTEESKKTTVNLPQGKKLQ